MKKATPPQSQSTKIKYYNKTTSLASFLFVAKRQLIFILACKVAFHHLFQTNAERESRN